MFKKKLENLKFDLNKITDQTILNVFKTDEKTLSDKKEIENNHNKNKKELIKITNLTKSFNVNKEKLVAVSNLNLTIYEGENIALLGGNGAGKTTTVEMIAGLNKPTSGSIEYKLEHNVSFKEKIGIQFQDSSYPVGIKVNQVIKFIMMINNIEIEINKFNAMLHIFGIDEFYYKKASSLSGGQQQRLNCLLSIINNPKFVILDELSTGLDVTIRTRIKRFIKEYAKNNNITILVVSHDMDEVDYLVDRIVIMKKGEIFLDLPKKDVIKKYGSISKCIDLYI